MQQVETLLRTIRLADPPYAAAPCTSSPPSAPEGFQVAVALLQRLNLSDSTSIEQATQEFAYWLLDAWHVGSEACDCGALLLVAVQDQSAAVAAGRGAERRMPVRAAAAITAAVKQELADTGDVVKAVLQGVQSIGVQLASSSGFPLSEGLWDLAIWVLLLGMVFMFFQPCRYVDGCVCSTLCTTTCAAGPYSHWRCCCMS